MILQLNKILVSALIIVSAFACKKDQEVAKSIDNDQSSIYAQTYFDFESKEKDSLKADNRIGQISEIGEYQVKSLTRYLLKLAPLNDSKFGSQEQEEIKQHLDLNNTYGIKIGNEPMRLFKSSYARFEDNRLVFTNNLKWLLYPVKKNIKDAVATLYKVDYAIKDSGVVTINTIGDARMYNREAQELRKSLDMLFDGQLKFSGNSHDTNGYLFNDYGVYTIKHVLSSIKKVDKSDYYLLFMGLNDFKSPFDEVKENLSKAIAILRDKNPESKILLTTLPKVAKDAKDSKSRNNFYDTFNLHLSSLVSNSGGANLHLIDLATALKNEQEHLRANGVHLLQRGYTIYCDLISQVLIQDPELGEHFTGRLENFDSAPLSDQVLFAENSNATAAGNFMLATVANQNGLLTELFPTTAIKAPHRAEMTVQLDPYFEDNSVWVGIDFNVPTTYQVDSTNTGSRSMIMQVHSKPNPGESWSSYQKNLPFNRPCLGFFLVKTENSYRVEMYYGLNGKPDMAYKDREWKLVGKTQIEPDIWNRLEFQIKMSHGEDGFVGAWINQKSLLSADPSSNKVYGANMHNDALPYLKFGQYRYWPDSHLHQVYFDNLKIRSTTSDYFYPEHIPSQYRLDVTKSSRQ